MTALQDASADAMIEECVDELDELIDSLQRFPETVLAFALRVHLGSLLRVLLENDLCTRAQARTFLSDLQEEVLRVD
jgi:hypothetical protein